MAWQASLIAVRSDMLIFASAVTPSVNSFGKSKRVSISVLIFDPHFTILLEFTKSEARAAAFRVKSKLLLPITFQSTPDIRHPLKEGCPVCPACAVADRNV